MAVGGSGRNLMRLFDGHDVDEEQRFFHDGSQVGSYSPPTGRVPAPRLGGSGFLTPAHGSVAPAAAALLPPHRGAFSAPAPCPFVDPPAPEGFDLNSQAAVSFPGLDEYERVLVADKAPPRRRSDKHVIATQGRLRGSIGRGSTSSVGVPPRPARSGVGRGGGGGSRERGGARARSVSNAARAHSRSNIHLETDEDGGYRTMSMEADAANMLLNSDEEEDNSDEHWIAATMVQWAEEDEEEEAAAAKRRKNLILSATELIVQSYGLRSTRRMSSVECDEDEEFIPMVDEPSRLRRQRQRRRRASQVQGQNSRDDHNMNVFRDWIAEGLHRRR